MPRKALLEFTKFSKFSSDAVPITHALLTRVNHTQVRIGGISSDVQRGLRPQSNGGARTSSMPEVAIYRAQAQQVLWCPSINGPVPRVKNGQDAPPSPPPSGPNAAGSCLRQMALGAVGVTVGGLGTLAVLLYLNSGLPKTKPPAAAPTVTEAPQDSPAPVEPEAKPAPKTASRPAPKKTTRPNPAPDKASPKPTPKPKPKPEPEPEPTPALLAPIKVLFQVEGRGEVLCGDGQKLPIDGKRSLEFDVSAGSVTCMVSLEENNHQCSGFLSQAGHVHLRAPCDSAQVRVDSRSGT